MKGRQQRPGTSRPGALDEHVSAGSALLLRRPRPPLAPSTCCAGRFGSANISRKITPITAATQPSAFWKASTKAGPTCVRPQVVGDHAEEDHRDQAEPERVAHLLHGVDQAGRRTGVLARHLREHRVGQRGDDQAHADAHHDQRQRHLPGGDAQAVPLGLPDVEQHAQPPSPARPPGAPCGRSAGRASARTVRPPPTRRSRTGRRSGPALSGLQPSPVCMYSVHTRKKMPSADPEDGLHGDARPRSSSP